MMKVEVGQWWMWCPPENNSPTKQQPCQVIRLEWRNKLWNAIHHNGLGMYLTNDFTPMDTVHWKFISNE